MNFTLQLRNAKKNKNDRKFFKLYQSSPHLSGYLVDYMLNPMRIGVYEATIKSYDTVSFPFMMQKLNFTEVKECEEFLLSRHVRFVQTAAQPEVAAGTQALKSKRKDKKKKEGGKQVAAAIPSESLRIDCRASRTAEHP